MSSFYIKVYPISLHSFITISFHILPCDKRVWKNEICFLTKTSIVACCIKVSKKSKYLEKTGKNFFFDDLHVIFGEEYFSIKTDKICVVLKVKNIETVQVISCYLR